MNMDSHEQTPFRLLAERHGSRLVWAIG